MAELKQEFDERPVAAAALLLFGFLGVVLGNVTSDHPEKPKVVDGIRYEKDGTALAGRESGKGWLDVGCNRSGEVTVRVVNSKWGVEQKGSFQSDGCDDGKLSPGELSMEDIPSDLRG